MIFGKECKSSKNRIYKETWMTQYKITSILELSQVLPQNKHIS